MTPSTMTSYHRGILISIACAIVLGAWPASVRAFYADGGNFAMALLAITVTRFAVLLIACLSQKHRMFQTRADIRSAATGGFFQALASIGTISSVLFLPGPLAMVIIYTNTLMLLLLMAVRGDIKLDKTTLGVTFAALAGLVLVLDLFHKQSTANWYGIVLAFGAAMAIASRFYVYDQQRKTLPLLCSLLCRFCSFKPCNCRIPLPAMAGFHWGA